MRTSLDAPRLDDIHTRLAEANAALARRYPGERSARQPVHTVYGGAHLFRAGTAAKLGSLARKSLEEHAPDAATFARALEMPEALAATLRARVVAKLEAEPVEDLRIDFEDGFGLRPDAEEDSAATAAARELAKGLATHALPPFVGIRIKSLGDETRVRSLRTLDLFVTTLLEASGGALPPRFVVTLPKITSASHVAALADVLDRLEHARGLAPGAIDVEIMVETTTCLVGADGRVVLPALLEAARGRLTGAHFGSYDYTAACGVAAPHQRMTHPACDFARHMMQVAFAGTGVALSDGATNVLPVLLHGAPSSDAQRAENRDAVHAAWRLHAANVHDSLVRGLYQGWDLHPAQLPARFAATYAFFHSGLDASARRLANFVDKAAQATLVGATFDDAATGQGLLNFFARATACGAVAADEATRLTGLDASELRGRSFLDIVERRRGAGDNRPPSP